MSNFKTYQLEYIGSSDVLRGKMMRDVDGEQREIGDLESKGFAGASLGFKPMVNRLGKIDIDMEVFERTETDINESVAAFGLVYEKGENIGQVITEFSDNPGHDLWIKWKMRIPYGAEGSPAKMSESDVKQRLGIALLKKSGIAWFPDYEERPPSLRSYLFIVREENNGGKSVISNTKTRKTAGFVRMLLGFSEEKLDFTCNVLNIPFDSKMSRESKENRIIDNLENDPTRLVFGDETLAEMVDYISKSSVSQISGMNIINKARMAGLLKREGGKYVFEAYKLGSTYKECSEFISLKENEDVAFKLYDAVKE